jgi:hypothetical protein
MTTRLSDPTPPEHRGIEGHRWSLHRTSGARLPCRIVCQCGWTSSAGEETDVLLQLKGHLEDCLATGARREGWWRLPSR